MKQPIAGIAGLKPRASGPKPDGRLSKQESRALDREYRVQRNETLRLKNHREAMLLAKTRGELILRDLVEKQAAYLLIAMRQRMLAVPQAYAGRPFYPHSKGFAVKIVCVSANPANCARSVNSPGSSPA